MKGCIFCDIVKGKEPCHKIWEDKKYLAFLSIYPNTEGAAVVIPKKHYSSYAFDLPDNELKDLIIVCKKVGKLLDLKLEDVGRTGLVLEGFGVDHVHGKLFPMHGTNIKKWKPILSKINKRFKKYPGYISSHSSYREDDEKLGKLAKKLKGGLV
ncbi:MAG: HIT family protein [archaeon]